MIHIYICIEALASVAIHKSRGFIVVHEDIGGISEATIGLAKLPLELGEKLRCNLVTRVAFNTP
jgi:hypothetical protein